MTVSIMPVASFSRTEMKNFWFFFFAEHWTIMSGDEKRTDADRHAPGMAESSLLSAARYLARSAGTGKTGDGGCPDFATSFKALLEWGERHQLIVPASNFAFFDRPPDGHGDEHEAWFDESTNTWFKATYPNRFGVGWRGEDSATPNEYLDRLILQNKYFGDRVELIALVNCGGKLRVLTSQPHVAGEPASYEEIQNWFETLGFKKVESSGSIAWYHSDENLLVADAHEGNVLRSKDDLLLPIDLNLIHPQGEMRQWIERQIEEV